MYDEIGIHLKHVNTAKEFVIHYYKFNFYKSYLRFVNHMLR